MDGDEANVMVTDDLQLVEVAALDQGGTATLVRDGSRFLTSSLTSVANRPSNGHGL
ncbi:hypothetical protein [Streptomyces spinosirectus]